MEKITFSDLGYVLYINPHESRGQFLLAHQGITQPKITSFWKKAVAYFQPSVALDVGVNYGEILFSSAYAKEVTVIGIEANDTLAPYIHHSLHEHPNREQIHIVYALASDRDDEQAFFYINPQYSGTSTAIPSPAFQQRQVRSVTIDTVMKGLTRKAHRLLFKMDVEGYEAKVWGGMEATLQACQEALGCIEFNNQFLEQAGTSGNELLEKLKQQFHVYYLLNDTQVVKFKSLDLNTLTRYFNKPNVHADLLLVQNEHTLQQLQYQITTYEE
ncbi:FkbM family methyltransferase [Paenibacillus taiwanensis]|uniref:FkbM family methyltransferase n=1 Tax=Paenibacillus taiwanensis TaxID=401638 RepID=UPI0003F83D03|nr:FkbM family methyltransferase [Paenibacillus taiwanensis]